MQLLRYMLYGVMFIASGIIVMLALGFLPLVAPAIIIIVTLLGYLQEK